MHLVFFLWFIKDLLQFHWLRLGQVFLLAVILVPQILVIINPQGQWGFAGFNSWGFHFGTVGAIRRDINQYRWLLIKVSAKLYGLIVLLQKILVLIERRAIILMESKFFMLASIMLWLVRHCHHNIWNVHLIRHVF